MNRNCLLNPGLPARLREDAGNSVIETAVASMVFLTMLIGIMQMSVALYTQHFLSYVAREATRYAIVRGSACQYLDNCNATSSQIQTWVYSLNFAGINPNNMTVTTTWPTTGAACSPSISPCNNPGNLVRVAVSYNYPMRIPLIPNRSIPMSSTSQMVISR